MAINIKNREAEALLSELKQLTGKGTSRIVLELLREEAGKLRGDRARDIAERRRQILEIGRQVRARLPADLPSDEDIIGYDEYGLPK